MVDLESQVKELEELFTILLEATTSKLTVENKSMDIVKDKLKVRQMPCSVHARHYQYVVDILNVQHKLFQNLEQLFLYLNMYSSNCFEYHFLHCVIKTSQCCQSLTAEMTNFERMVLELQRKTKISEFVKSRCELYSRMMPAHFESVATEYEIDPDQHRLIDLDKFRVDLATSLNLVAEFPIQMIMVEVRQGRTVVEWMIPSELLEDVTSLLCSEIGQTILAVHQISDVFVDGRPPAERHAVRP